MWYYIENGQQQGPFDNARWDELISGGTIASETMVWKAGEPAWLPLRQFQSSIAAPRADQASSCTLCHQNVGADNLIELMGVRICAACKPLALQSLQEGVDIGGANATYCDGKNVVVNDGAHLPRRCVKCNDAATETSFKRKVHWHPWGFYLLIFAHIIIYIIVAIFVRKKAVVHAYMCRRHIQVRRYYITGGWVGGFLGFCVFCWAVADSNVPFIWLGAALFFGAIITGFAGGRVVWPKRIKNKTVWLRGAGKEFLASLPPWPGTTS